MTETQNPLLPVAVVTHDKDLGMAVVSVSYPAADVDRPITYGIAVKNPTVVARLVKAINAGAVMVDAHIATDINGATYVAATSLVHGRTPNADLKRIGF